MKKKKILKNIKSIITIILFILELIALSLFGYSLILYKGVETFYRIFAIIILIYLFIFFTYLLLRSIKINNLKSFIIPFILFNILLIIELGGYYYLTKIYKSINNYSDNKNLYHSSLVTYNKKLNDYKKLNNNTIGIVNDKNDIEGNVLPNEIINNLNLKEKNKIIEYNSTIELLHDLKNKKIDCAFFSSNYIDMFYSLEGFENIETESKVLYSTSKEYISNEQIENKNSTLDTPFNILLIGVDSSKDGVTAGYNADVLLLVSFNPKTLRATITSIPRDMYIQTACSGKSYRRINTTTWGSSSSCAVKTVEKLFDVKINYYAKINFKGIVSLVDAVGGIDVDVPYALCEQNSSRHWGDKTVYIKKGKQHLDGEQALALARNRHSWPSKCSSEWNQGTRNDYVRGKNQMKVIMGIVNSANKLTDPNQAIEILEKIDKNFQTNVKTKDILSFYDLGKSILIFDNSNLINVQRLQLSGKNMWRKIYEPYSKSYPAVTIPYKESIETIKNEININLGKTKPKLVKNISFDLNHPYKDNVLGSGNYSNIGITTLKDLSNMSLKEIKNYATQNKLTLNVLNYDTNEIINEFDFDNYYFVKQNEHVDTIINQLNSITIYAKKRSTITIETPKTPSY